MKKHLLLTLSAVLVGLMSAFAGIDRAAATEYIDRPVGTVSKSPLFRHAAKPRNYSSVRLHNRVQKAPAAYAAAKGRFAGLCNYPTTSWSVFNASGVPSRQWATSANAGTGFVADGKVYTFYNTVSQNYELLGIGLNIFDTASGSLLESISYSVFDDKDKIVYGAAYNESEGVAYVVTDNGSGGYLMQKFNPSTKAYSLVCKLPASTSYPMAMAWHARNNGIYMISEAAYLERFNANKGAFNRVGDTGLLIDEDEYGYPGSMVYSPKDENFVALIEQGEAYTGFYTVDALSGKATALTSLGDDSQWRVLTCLDSSADTAAPDTPSAVSAIFPNGSLSGTVEVSLPAKTVGGANLTGDVFAVVSEGTSILSNTVSGAPGTSVSVPITLEAGIHTLSVAAMQKSGDNTLTSPAVKISVTVGSDVPGAPSNVVLTENNVSWDAPAAANGGFLDLSSVKYNVYVNGELIAGSPFAGTSATITIPAGGNVAKKAAVEAVQGDYVSPRGESNVFVGRQPFSLPCEIAPLPGATNLENTVINLFRILDVNNDKRTWIYDEQKEQTGGFYYLCHSSNPGNDWLVLPQMHFDKPGFYRLSMEVWCGSNSYFASPEKFEVGFGAEASASGLKVVSDVYTVTPRNNFEPYELSFQVETAGDYYVGVHCVSDVNQFRLYARNFLVESAQGTSAAPAAVADLNATAAEYGALQANVSFTMPLSDVDGAALASGSELTATVTCGEATATATGAPGEKINVSVAAVQGVNTVSVRVSSEDGSTSPASSVELYVGVDVPGIVDLSKTITADNMSATLHWTLSTVGSTGRYVDPATCQYEIYRLSAAGTYIKVGDAGVGATEWTFSVAPGTAQDVYGFGVRPVNVAGGPNSFAICDVMLGVLNDLPMKELFRSQGDAVITNYDPIGVQNVAEQYCSWAFVDPKDYNGGEPNATSTALMAYYQGLGQVTFPRFSTVGVDNVKVTVSMLHGAMSSTEVIIAVATPEDSFIPVATVDLSQGSGWQNTSVSLPESCINQGWAGLTIRCYNPTQLHMFMMDGYTIEVNKSTGVALESVEASGKVRVGSECKVNVTLANYTSAEVEVPALKAEFKAENGEVYSLTADEGAPTTIQRGQKALVTYTFVAAPEHLGFGFVNVEIADPAKRDGTGADEARVIVVKGYSGFISDLSATEVGGKASLTWSAPENKEYVTEDFEDFEIWARGENLGDFRNLDYDLQTTYAISGYSYPGKYEATAFEVFAGSEFPVAILQAFGGDQYIAAFAPDSRGTSPADDWLISPRIAGGTKVQMQILAPSNEFGEETVELLYSTNGDDSSEFETLATFTTKDMQWQKVEAELPVDARYFALHYTGFDTFCLLIDDLVFSPYESTATVKEYKVFADGVEIGASTTTAYTADISESGSTYYVVPVLKFADGSEKTGVRSNIVRVGFSGADGVATGGSVTAVDGGIVIAGVEGYVYVYAADGTLVASEDSATRHFVPTAVGVYVVAAGDKVYKVAVR